MNKQKTFSQPWYTSVQFTDQIDICCPNCGKQAKVTGNSRYLFPWNTKDCRIICTHCSYNKTQKQLRWQGPLSGKGWSRCKKCGTSINTSCETNGKKDCIPKAQNEDCPRCKTTNELEISWSIIHLTKDPIDPYLGLNLWYQKNIKNNILWFYNIEHMEYIEDYISSTIRERGLYNGKYSIITNLPTWIKDAKNRSTILKTIKQLKV